MLYRFILLLLGLQLGLGQLAHAQTSPNEGMYVDLGWTVGRVNYTTPYLGTPASQYALGQPYFRYTTYDDKFLLQSDLSGWVDAVRGLIKKLGTKDYGGSALASHAVQDPAGGYGRDICIGSLLYAKGSKHFKVGGQVSFYDFGIQDGTNIGVLRDNQEALLGLSTHYVRQLGSYSHLRLSLFGDRIFHKGDIRGYAGTGEAELRLHLTGRLNLLAQYQLRERFYAGQHSGTPSPFSADPNVIFPLGAATDNLPVRALTQAVSVGLALHFGS